MVTSQTTSCRAVVSGGGLLVTGSSRAGKRRLAWKFAPIRGHSRFDLTAHRRATCESGFDNAVQRP